MAGAKDAAVKVDGLKDLQRAIRQAQDKDLRKQLRGANKSAAEVVKGKAEGEVPEKTGRLRKSLGVRSSDSSAKVKAGSAARVPYAGAIHFGWPRRGIEPNRFLNRSLWRTRDQVQDVYEVQLQDLIDFISSRKV